MLTHGHRDQPARRYHEGWPFAACDFGQCVLDPGFERLKGFWRAFKDAILPGGENPWKMGCEMRMFGGYRDAVLGFECGGEREVFKLVQPCVACGCQPRVHPISGFHVPPQCPSVEPCMALVCVAQVLPEPGGLFVAERAELVVTGLVFGGGIGLTVTDECDVGHGRFRLVFALF